MRARQAVAEAETFLHRALNDALASCARDGLTRKESARRLGISVRSIDRNGRYIRPVRETRRLLQQAFAVIDYDDLSALREVLQRFTGVRYSMDNGETINLGRRDQGV